MKIAVVNAIVGIVKVLLHTFGFCTCCKKEEKK